MNTGCEIRITDPHDTKMARILKNVTSPQEPKNKIVQINVQTDAMDINAVASPNGIQRSVSKYRITPTQPTAPRTI